MSPYFFHVQAFQVMHKFTHLNLLFYHWVVGNQEQHLGVAIVMSTKLKMQYTPYSPVYILLTPSLPSSTPRIHQYIYCLHPYHPHHTTTANIPQINDGDWGQAGAMGVVNVYVGPLCMDGGGGGGWCRGRPYQGCLQGGSMGKGNRPYHGEGGCHQG